MEDPANPWVHGNLRADALRTVVESRSDRHNGIPLMSS